MEKILSIFYKENKVTDKYCCICFDKLNEINIYSCYYCKKPFHNKCIKKWFAIKNNCPMCRKTIITESKHNNFHRYLENMLEYDSSDSDYYDYYDNYYDDTEFYFSESD